MKIRNGFVSNSSASSFLVAFDPKINIKLFGIYDKNYSEEETRVRAAGSNEVIEFFKKEYGFDEFDAKYHNTMRNFSRFAKQCAMVANAISEGKEVAYITIPFYDQTTLERMKHFQISILKEYP